MLVTNLTQGTPEWKAYRNTRVTATDFCVIAADKGLCTNLYKKSLNTLINDKINAVELADNKYFKLGRIFEPIILNHYKDINNSDLIEINTIHTHDKNSRIMASLDAAGDCIIEIKTTSKDESHFDNQIDYYTWQVIHQCYTSGYDKGIILIGYLQSDENDELYLKRILQQEIIPSEIISKKDWLHLCEEFLKKLDDANHAPESILDMYNKYRSIDEEIKILTQKKEDIKQQIIDHYPDGIIFKEFNLSKQSRITYKYADYVKDNQISLDDKYKTETNNYIIRNNKND